MTHPLDLRVVLACVGKSELAIDTAARGEKSSLRKKSEHHPPLINIDGGRAAHFRRLAQTTKVTLFAVSGQLAFVVLVSKGINSRSFAVRLLLLFFVITLVVAGLTDIVRRSKWASRQQRGPPINGSDVARAERELMWSNYLFRSQIVHLWKENHCHCFFGAESPKRTERNTSG